MGRHEKKDRGSKPDRQINLATAIINLITALLILLDRLTR